jgi:hypothetical protein
LQGELQSVTTGNADFFGEKHQKTGGNFGIKKSFLSFVVIFENDHGKQRENIRESHGFIHAIRNPVDHDG